MLSEYENAVLEIISKSNNGLNWYVIEIRLSNVNLSERPHLLNKLSELTVMGLLYFDSEKECWSITEDGKSVIETNDE